jgi:23S rRNA (guanine2445-N2)-methyltransferase / 23S rRNA (guanine2069-N7)-methyltransferase
MQETQDLKRFFVTAPKGLEELLAEELSRLGGEEVRQGRAGVQFSAPLETAYRVLLWSRLGNRLLLPLAEFPAPSAEALYRGVQSVPWDEHLAADGTLAVDFTGGNAGITHTHFGALKVKDAVVDWFRDRYDRRPGVDTERPDLRINLHLHRDAATLSLDLSGDSLHRRGYRTEGGQAPLKENLAAAILLRAGWPEIAAAGGCLLDPMCGSGTLLVEGAWMAADCAPGLLREEWGFFGWQGHRPGLWQGLLDEARERRAAGLERLPPILGYDGDERAVRLARRNIERAGLAGRIRVETQPLERLAAPAGSGLLAVNPPYGERLGELEEVRPLYRLLGERLRQGFTGWRAAVFTGNPDLGKEMGLRAHKMNRLFNGALECRLLQFEVAPEQFVQAGPRAFVPLELDLENHPFANRLRKNLRHLRKWAQREGVSCYRVYDADIPEYAVAVDLYEDWVHVQEYAPPAEIETAKAERRWREVLSALPLVLQIDPERIFSKTRQRQKGSAQYRKLDDSGVFHEVREGPARLLVNFVDYLDTGLFLDHRVTRGLLRQWAAGKRFLNLFCYTGSATVQAALGGAATTTSVDLSPVYLEWARRNLELNGIRGPFHRLIRDDCREWIERDRGHYDLIFLDPPTFSNSKRMEGTFDVQRDHVPLIRAALARLTPGGRLVFSTNHRRFRFEAEAFPEARIEDYSARTLPEDFKRNPRIHRCWVLQLP